jgi:cytochrome c oxidase cbb3-type subunit III
MPGLSGLTFFAACALSLASCSEESRAVGPDLPQTAPNGAQDPRAARYERNVYQVGQGGRYFIWYGCGECHGGGATGSRNLGDNIWVHGSDLDQVYAFIARGHRGALGRYGERIPAEQLWQITAYVRTLPQLTPKKRRRHDVDQVGEPQGASWAGPVR